MSGTFACSKLRFWKTKVPWPSARPNAALRAAKIATNRYLFFFIASGAETDVRPLGFGRERRDLKPCVQAQACPLAPDRTGAKRVRGAPLFAYGAVFGVGQGGWARPGCRARRGRSLGIMHPTAHLAPNTCSLHTVWVSDV